MGKQSVSESLRRQTSMYPINHILALTLTLLIAGHMTDANAQTKSNVKLVLQVTVDGLCADLLNRYGDRFGKN